LKTIGIFGINYHKFKIAFLGNISRIENQKYILENNFHSSRYHGTRYLLPNLHNLVLVNGRFPYTTLTLFHLNGSRIFGLIFTLPFAKFRQISRAANFYLFSHAEGQTFSVPLFLWNRLQYNWFIWCWFVFEFQ